MNLIGDILTGHQTGQCQTKLRRNAHSLGGNHAAIHSDVLLGKLCALQLILEARETDRFAAVQNAEVSQNARRCTDGGKIDPVARAVFGAGRDDRRFLEIQRAGHAAGQNHHLHVVGRNVLFLDIGCNRNAMRAGHGLSADADGFDLQLRSAQDIYRRERLNFFKPVRKKNVDHNRSSNFVKIS